MAGLGLGLGLGGRGRRLFKESAKAGTLSEFMGRNPALKSLFMERLNPKGPLTRTTKGGYQGNFVYKFPKTIPTQAGRQQTRAQAFAAMGKFDPNWVAPPSETTGTPPALPTGAPPPPGAAPMTQAELEKIYGGEAPAGVRDIGAYTRGQLQGLGNMKLPSFDDMFGRWLDVANREAGRQGAAITEAMGARGARYGSDILREQADFRRKWSQDIASMADEIQRGLYKDVSGREASLMSGGLGAGGIEANMLAQARQRMFLDALRTTGVPPLLAAGAGMFENQQPTDIAFFS